MRLVVVGAESHFRVCVCVCVRYPLCWMMFEKGQHRMGERVLLRYCIRLGFDLNALQICICLPVRCHAWTCVRRIDWLVGCATIRFATGAFTRLDMYVCQILFAFDLLPVRLRAWVCMYVKCCLLFDLLPVRFRAWIFLYVKCCLLLIYYRCGFAPGYVCMSSVVCFCHKTVREQFSLYVEASE